MQRRQQSADELDQAGADQVADAFDIGHDARDQRAGLVGVVVGDRQPADMLLHFLPQLGDQPLRRLRQQLRQGERGDALDDGRQYNRSQQREAEDSCGVCR